MNFADATTATIIDTVYGQVSTRIEEIENSEGEQVWAIVSSWITKNGGFARMEFSYEPETELEDVIGYFNDIGVDHKELLKAMATAAAMGV